MTVDIFHPVLDVLEHAPRLGFLAHFQQQRRITAAGFVPRNPFRDIAIQRQRLVVALQILEDPRPEQCRAVAVRLPGDAGQRIDDGERFVRLVVEEE